MKTLNILLVSDFHSGAATSSHTGGTSKDKTLSRRLAADLLYTTTRDLFLSSVMSLLHGTRVDLLACCGDLGHQGTEASVSQGVQYLKKLAATLGVSTQRVLVAPGNHDLARRAKVGRELTHFSRACRRAGFLVPDRTRPSQTDVNGIPVLCVNSCLGGTEHALHEVPAHLWSKIKRLLRTLAKDSKNFHRRLRPTILDQITDLDIPALGTTQLTLVHSILRAAKGDCAVILGHHNPIATPMLDIRPYSNLVDAGSIVYSLIETGMKVLFLHGHAHCDCAISLHSPTHPTGMFTAIGSQGLHDTSATGHAALIKLYTDNSSSFLTATVTRFAQTGSVYMSNQDFVLHDTSRRRFPEQPLAIDSLERDKVLTVADAARAMGRTADETLAEEIIRSVSTTRLTISGLTNEDWRTWTLTRM